MKKELQRIAAGLFQQWGIELDTDQYVSELSLLGKDDCRVGPVRVLNEGAINYPEQTLIIF